MTNLNETFSNCKSLEELDLNGWDTSNITKMQELFGTCCSLKYINIKDWDTSRCTSMYNLFISCSSLVSLDVSDWDTSNVTNISSLISGCSKLESLDLSKWNTRKVNNFYLFSRYNTALKYLDISGFDTRNGSFHSLTFQYNNNLRYIKVGPGLFLMSIIPFHQVSVLGLNPDNSSNGWLEHITEQAPIIRLSDNWNQETWNKDKLEQSENTPHILTQENSIWYINDGQIRTIQLNYNLKNKSWAQPYIQILQDKGYTVL